MSEQPPPSFGGHPNYAQHWPPAYPAMLPPNFPIPKEFSAVNPQTNHDAPYDYNMASVDANSRIAAPGDVNPAAFFPPQFPFFGQFDPSQFPPTFPPMHLAPMGYPPVPTPTGSSNPPVVLQPPSQQRPIQTSTKGLSSKAAMGQTGSNREEGDISERTKGKPIQSNRRSTRQYSDLEEGETVSSSDSSSRRSSGSPYNPPLSVSADPSIIPHAMEPQNGTSKAVDPGPSPPKTTAQLRIQAQGALLSLAPHHIRYKELVAEGINPVILKRLYEEVGIKVISDSENAPPVAESLPTIQKETPSAKEKPDAVKSNVPVPRAASQAASQPKTGKPMERKELIAQMLAEKAAKAASKEDSPIGSTTSTPVAQSESRPLTREKNKAKTDLARQRIEELRQKMLLQTQQKKQEPSAPVSHESLPPAIHHPLPVRPPLPESRSTTGLPGLLMTGSEEQSDSVSDQTPASRPTPRKRPLASDFDEPASNPKKHLNPTASRFNPADKLIIAISDDESLYGDDEDDEMELDSGSEQEPATIISSTIPKIPIQPSLSETRASTSTPQAASSSNEQGNIQTRDLEIQAMHRRIAELELRQKSKLAASRAQSPRTSDESGISSSSAQPTTAKPGISDIREITVPQQASVPAALGLAPELSLVDSNPESVEDIPPVSASLQSDSDGSAMQESDDSDSDDSSDSDSESESEDEPVDTPAQVDMAISSEPMDIDSPRQSVAENSSIANGSRQTEQSQRESSIESEAYEPPEPDAEARSEASSYSPPPFSPAPEPVDLTAALKPSLDAAQTTAELTSTSQASGPSSQLDPQTEASSVDSVPKNSAYKFTPYTSPLRSFKAYRYHPNYAEDIPSGYRSLTYSHNIDSMKSFCPYEIAGGVCNDRSCEFQHLRDTSLSDDKILIQMGSAREGQTEEEKETYLAGLKEIINDLRRDKVKDFNTVATEIAAYRRRFLQDPSRVLSL